MSRLCLAPRRRRLEPLSLPRELAPRSLLLGRRQLEIGGNLGSGTQAWQASEHGFCVYSRSLLTH